METTPSLFASHRLSRSAARVPRVAAPAARALEANSSFGLPRSLDLGLALSGLCLWRATFVAARGKNSLIAICVYPTILPGLVTNDAHALCYADLGVATGKCVATVSRGTARWQDARLRANSCRALGNFPRKPCSIGREKGPSLAPSKLVRWCRCSCF